MKQPETILENGIQVRTHETLTHNDLPGIRRPNVCGNIARVMGGMGGDVYVVQHDDGMQGAYCFDEFELESDQSSRSTDKYDKRERIDDIYGDDLLVRWDIDPPTKGVISLAPRRYDSATLDLAGIAALRAALDKAEAAYRKHHGIEPCSELRLAQMRFEDATDGNNVDELNAAFDNLKRLNSPAQWSGWGPKGPTIGERIRAIRRATGKNLEDTAKAMGTSIPHASALERGYNRPTTEEIAALAALYGVDAKELTG